MLEQLRRHKRAAAACMLGAGILLFPGSVLMLAVGAAAGFYGGIRFCELGEKGESQ